MVAKYWSVHCVMEGSCKTAQKARKKRAQSEKVGRLKYLIELAKRIDGKMDSLDRRISRIERYRKRDLEFVRGDIEDVCVDEVDREIVRLLFEAGDAGLYPRVIADKLENFKITRFQVARRIQRMNKLLHDRLDECLFEMRGWHWALSKFAFEAWGGGSGKAGDSAVVAGEEAAWE
jgi:hypothetical protein